MSEEQWISVQKKTFTKWCNANLRRKYGKTMDPLSIDNVNEEFDDGITLIKLIHALYGTSVPKYNKKPKMRPHKLDNICIALKMVDDQQIKTNFLKPVHLADHDLKMILGMIWSIILDYQINGISVEELSAKEGLLRWCQKKTEGYQDVKVENFHTSFKDGLAFCALIHKHRPDLIDFDSLSKDNAAENLSLAFNVAEEKLGIPQLLDVEDLTETEKPDERSVMTYVSEYFRYFSSLAQSEVAGRRIAKVVNFTKTNDELKEEYNNSAEELLNWINQKTEELGNRDFDNTLEGVKGKINEFNDYKQNEKPAKTAEKLDVERKYANIALKLSSNNRPAFVPKEGCATADLNVAWERLEQAERDRNQALEDELARQERLEALVNRFRVKRKVLTDFANSKLGLLKSQEGEQFNSVGQVQARLQMLDAFDNDLENSKARLSTAVEIGNELIAANYKDSETIQTQIGELNDLWAQLGSSSSSRREELDTELARQQKMEDLRKEFAEKAKALDRYVKDACENARDHTNFGLTLEDVQNYRATLESTESEVLAKVEEQKQAVDSVNSELESLGSKNNRYTPLTVDSIAGRIETLKGLLQERVQAYETELNRQEEMEAVRKQFAAEAEEFVSYINQQREVIGAVDGDPEEQQSKVNELYNEEEGASKLQAIKDLDENMRNMGIVSNSHTNLSLRNLEARWNSFKAFVQHALEDIESAIVLKQNQEAALAEMQEQQKLEDMKINYAKKCTVLNEWLQNADEVLNDPIHTNSIEGVSKYQEEFNQVESEYDEKTAAKDELVAYNDELVAAGINENPLAELTVDELNSQWENVTNTIASRKQELSDETARQTANEELRVNFATKAQEVADYIASTLEQAQSFEGEVQEQLDSLNNLNIDLSGLDEVSSLNDQLKEAGVRDNKHTNLTFEELNTRAKSLRTTVDDLRKNLESELMSKQHGQVPAEQLAEIKECFNQFDKNQNGFLVNHELKACLSALDEVVSDEQLEDILKQYGDENNNITLQGFTDFMINRLEDTHDQSQILDSFKILCDGRDYITEAELQPGFGSEPETLAYLLANMPKKEGLDEIEGYDYVAYVESMFSR